MQGYCQSSLSCFSESPSQQAFEMTVVQHYQKLKNSCCGDLMFHQSKNDHW